MPEAGRVFFAYPGDLDTPTGGYGYDRRIIDGLRRLGWQVELMALGDGFPFPGTATLAAALDRLKAVPDGSLVVLDGLAYGVMAQEVAQVAGRLRLIALVHHPLCLESGVAPDVARRLEQSERDALTSARHVIATSDATTAQVRDLFGTSSARLSAVLPGTDPAKERHWRQSGAVQLLSVGTIVPRKGYDLLFAALERLKHLDWHLDIVGDTTRHLECFEELQQQVKHGSLTERVTFHGAVSDEDLAAFYLRADLFVLASRYEGYGMAFSEALSRGIPVIGSGDGAVRDTLGVDGAIYCPTEDVQALVSALASVMEDRRRLEKLHHAAWTARSRFPTWEHAAARFDEILRKLK